MFTGKYLWFSRCFLFPFWFIEIIAIPIVTTIDLSFNGFGHSSICIWLMEIKTEQNKDFKKTIYLTRLSSMSLPTRSSVSAAGASQSKSLANLAKLELTDGTNLYAKLVVSFNILEIYYCMWMKFVFITNCVVVHWLRCMEVHLWWLQGNPRKKRVNFISSPFKKNVTPLAVFGCRLIN